MYDFPGKLRCKFRQVRNDIGLPYTAGITRAVSSRQRVVKAVLGCAEQKKRGGRLWTAWKFRTRLVHCFGFAGFKFCPALPCRLRRVHARFKFSFFEKISPALVAIV